MKTEHHAPKGLVERYGDQIIGQLRCWDRVVITGTMVDVCHPGAMEWELRKRDIRCFDIGQFAEPLKETVRANAEAIAQKAGVEIEFIASKSFRQEKRIAEILEQRGKAEGLVHVFSVMETCPAFKPWHNKTTHHTGVKLTRGKCLHYYFYEIHPRLGLCYVRVPTWLPFRLQVYFNGHNWLANPLRQAGLGFSMQDNAFTQMTDWGQAQSLADEFEIQELQQDLEALARRYCPVVKEFAHGYHWSLMQVEYAWDIAFGNREALAPIYQEISRQAILTVRAANVAHFLGKRIPMGTNTPVESHFHTRVEGTCIRHVLGPASIKMYDKHGQVLRIECTANNVSFFKHYRKVEHRDGTADYAVTALKKSIYSLGDLRGLMRAAIGRYLEFIGALEDRSPGQADLDKITRSIRDQNDRSYRGFNFFAADDLRVLQTILRGEYTISGMSNRFLRRILPCHTPHQIGRILKRLRLHGLIKKIGRTYKYYVTSFGQKTLLIGLKLREHLILPSLAYA